MCVGVNTADDPGKTIAMFRELPVRKGSDTHLAALDFLMIAPFAIDNVNPPKLDKTMGIDAEVEYRKMIQHICWLYSLRWHDSQ